MAKYVWVFSGLLLASLLAHHSFLNTVVHGLTMVYSIFVCSCQNDHTSRYPYLVWSFHPLDMSYVMFKFLVLCILTTSHPCWCKISFFTSEAAVDKTSSLQGPFSSRCGAFYYTMWPSCAHTCHKWTFECKLSRWHSLRGLLPICSSRTATK